MRIPGVKMAKQFSRWARSRILGGALILGYHRITTVPHDQYEICVSPKHFAQQMDVLSKYANVISLSKLVRCLKEGTLPLRSVAVTFDDGYADNLYEAKPVLENFRTPATFFVCTEYLGTQFWWDQISWWIKSPASLPEHLKLDLSPEPFEWNSAGSNRSELIKSLHLRLFSLQADERNAALTKIHAWSSASSFDASNQRVLTSDELLQLAASERIEIGSHTRTHAVLPKLPIEKQSDEIGMSRKQLSEMLGRQIDGFSYPNGALSDQTLKLVQELGYSYACMSDSGLARDADVIYQLPRLWPKDWDGYQFLMFLKRWLSV